jgi:hypothetical protein
MWNDCFLHAITEHVALLETVATAVFSWLELLQQNREAEFLSADFF